MLQSVRTVYRYLTATIFALIVVQIGLAAYGAFDEIHKAEGAPVTKKSAEDAFGAHAILGSVVVLLMIVLLIVAVAGRMDVAKVRWAAIIAGLGVLQFILGVVSTSTPAVGFLHGLNATAIFVATGMLAHRTWRSDQAGADADTESQAGYTTA
jgi:hypothetical protein